MVKLIAFSTFTTIVLLGSQLWAQYGPPPVIGRRAAAADTGGVGGYGDTMDEMIGNGTRTQWGMGRGLSGDATLGSGVSGYSAMGVAGFGQTTGASQIVPYYSLGGMASEVNYGRAQFGLGATPGFGRTDLGAGPAGSAPMIYGSAPAWPSSYAGQGQPRNYIPQEHVQAIMRVTRSPYAPAGNPGFVDPGVAARANEYTYGSTAPANSATTPQTLTGSQSAYPSAATPPAAPPQPPK